ncbi:MAG: hypothetical protein IJ111_04870 [Eggerthellaceae bacterium]|nr:hypothetical protein [Eggerthellaceae bacterium]
MGVSGTRAYEIGGKRYRFDHHTFNRAFKRRAKEGGRSLEQYAGDIGEAVHVSEKAVKAWRYGNNAPGGIEIVDVLAHAMGVEKGAFLIGEEGCEMKRLTEAEHGAVMRVYAAVSDFMYMLDHTDGCVWKGYRVFPGSPWCEYLTPSTDYGEGPCAVLDGTDLACAGHDWVCHVLDREYAALGGHPVYGELAAFMDGPLLDIWNGKTDPDYRFHGGEGSAPSTELAEKQLLEIIARYA